MSRAKTVTPVDEDAAETQAVNANSSEGKTERGVGGGAASDAAASAGGEPAAEADRATGSATAEPATEAGHAPTAESAPTAEADQATDTAAAGEPATEADRAAAEGEAADSEAAETGPAEAEVTPAKPRPVWRRLPVLLLAAAVVLTGAGVWFTLEARSAAADPAAANAALTDVGATADVTSAVTLAVNRIFSYSYDRTDVTEKAAAAVLRGSAKDSYDKLFAEVRKKAPQQKLVLTSRVSASAVQELKNGHARLLVFLDQSAVRADNNATDSAAAQLSVTAEHTTGGWVITELEAR
ncbi:hypothetical protein PV458_13645 [Streptomyces sp. MN03-5084-2B]|nr:hypothetical protein [Streptomyces sp. MN03-5084-2B]